MSDTPESLISYLKRYHPYSSTAIDFNFGKDGYREIIKPENALPKDKCTSSVLECPQLLWYVEAILKDIKDGVSKPGYRNYYEVRIRKEENKYKVQVLTDIGPETVEGQKYLLTEGELINLLSYAIKNKAHFDFLVSPKF